MHVCLNLSVFLLQRTAWFPPSYAGKLWPYRGPWNLMMPAVKVNFPDSMGQLLLLHLSPLTPMSFLRHLEERLWSAWSWDCPPGTLVAVHRWRLRGLSPSAPRCAHMTQYYPLCTWSVDWPSHWERRLCWGTTVSVLFLPVSSAARTSLVSRCVIHCIIQQTWKESQHKYLLWGKGVCYSWP